MNEMRKLMEAVEKIDESYFSRMAAAIDELIVNNPNLSQDKLVAIVRSKFGQEAASYLSDKFESEADLDDWENSDPQPHMREDEGDDKKEFLDKLKGVPKEPLYVGFDQSGDIERAVNVKLKGEDHEIHGYDHADRPNLIKVTVGDYADNMQDLFYDKDLKKIVDPLDKDFDAWMDQNPFEEVELEENPLIGMAVRAVAAGAGKAVADKVMDEDEVEESFRDKNDPIVKQVKSLLQQGKSVISRLQGAAGVVSDASVEDGTITYKDQNFGENVTFKVSDKEGLELVGQIDHYSLVARSADSIDEDIASWIKRLDKKAGAWITKKADTMIAKKVAEIVREEGINDAMISVQYLSGGGGKTIKSSLESYLKHSPEGEYAEEVRYILPALDKDTNDMRDAEISAFGSPLGEGDSDTYQRPYENEKEWMGKKVVITSCRDKSLEGEWGVVVDIDKYRNEEGEWEMKYVLDMPDGMDVTLYPSEWSYDQLELASDPMSDFMLQNPFESLEEAKGSVVEVPAGLRGEGPGKTGKATSDDAEQFLADLGIDDQVSHDVVDPETGEVLFQTGQTKREEMKKGAHFKLNHGDFTAGATLAPTMHGGWDGGDFEKKQEDAWNLINELRDSDFYNVVWREVGGVDMDTGDEDAFQDYDTEYEVPVAIKRKDGQKLDDDDHDNMREIVRAVKNGSTMQNTGIQYVGVTNGGTVARFVPSFM